jgi:hypothetical protein
MAYRVAVGETESKIMSLLWERARLQSELDEARRLHLRLVRDAALERERDRRWAEARLSVATAAIEEKQAREDSRAQRDAERARSERIALRHEVALLRDRAMQLEAEVCMLVDDRDAAILHYRARLRSSMSIRERSRIERILARLCIHETTAQDSVVGRGASRGR